ncbi:TPA: hypothetical protein ACXI73_000331 [Stenotrophomonas maltophilia]
MEWASSSVTLILGLLALILTMLWVFVPFAIFGVKSLLKEILSELRRANVIAEARAPEAAGAPSVVPAAVEAEPKGTFATIRAAVRQADRP